MKKLNKRLLRIIYPIMRLFWTIFRPNTVGVRIAVFNKFGEVLLLKHSYREGYYFPGGGLHKGEGFEDGAIRETYEETVLKINKKDIHLVGIYQYFEEGKNDVIAFFKVLYVGDVTDIQKDDVEVDDLAWFSMNSMPKELSHGLLNRLDDIKKELSCIIGIW